MTCIAAIADGETVWMGGDRASCRGDSIDANAGPKVFIKEGIIFGVTGDARVLQVVQHGLMVPPIGDESIEQYIAIKFINELRRCAVHYGFMAGDGGSDKMDGRIMLGMSGSLFVISEWFAFTQVANGYEAIGCGENVARGVLYVMKGLNPEYHINDPSETIRTALSAAERHCSGVRDPFDILALGKDDC